MGFNDQREEDAVLDCGEIKSGEYQFIFVNPNDSDPCRNCGDSCGDGYC